MDFLQLLSDYGILIYGLFIFFFGKFGLEYFTYFQKTKHNFLLFATIAAFAFIAMEVAAGTYRRIDFARYGITYAVVTTCYEQVSDLFPFLKPKNKKEE